MGEIAKNQIEKIMKDATSMRVSAKAVEVLTEFIEDVAVDISATASDLAATAKRKTVTVDDIKLALKRM